MNHPQDGLPAPTTASLALRDVHRAITRLRRGATVRLQADAQTTLILLAAETASATGLADLAEQSVDEPVLFVAPARAANLRGGTPNQPRTTSANRAETLYLPPSLLSPEALHSLADPTLPQIPPLTAWAPDYKAPEFGTLESGQPSPAVSRGGTGGPAAIALAKLARLLPAVVAAKAAHNAPAISAAAVLGYPAAASRSLVRVAEALVPLEDAPDARVLAFRAPETAIEHLAIVIGRPETRDAPLVRIHSECFTGDLLGSLRCDCGAQLRAAIRRIAEDGGGALLYLSQEGRGIGLVNKLRAYALQDRGLDTYDANGELGWGADERDYLAAAKLLELLGISRLRLLTNNPDKLSALIACGVDVVGRESHIIPPNGVNDRYLATKASRFGHLFSS
jgi:GTP cyclohydrolase II